MKKLFMLAIVAAAFTFTSCGSKSNEQAQQTDVEEVAEVANDDPVANMKAQLESSDANKFQTAIAKLWEKAAQLLKDNPDKAKEILSTAQQFLKDNADKVATLIGDNEVVKGLVNTLTQTDVEEVANGLLQQIGVVQDAQEKVDEAKEVVDDAKAAAENVKEAAKSVKDALGL